MAIPRANTYVKSDDLNISDLENDVKSGYVVAELLRTATGSVSLRQKPTRSPRMRIQMIENVNIVLIEMGDRFNFTGITAEGMY